MVFRAVSKGLARARNDVRRATLRRPSAHQRDEEWQGQHAYAGDCLGSPALTYAPINDDFADPGEVVWTWVPYEEDYSRGKDRPVLVIGRHQGLLLALQLTSQDHDRDAEDEARWGRYWVDIGAGDWDRDRRPSEVRVDRVLQLDPAAVRRIGAVLPEDVFTIVAAAVGQRKTHPEID